MAQWADSLREILATHYATQEFFIVLPKLHGRFRIGLPEVHGRFRMDPPKWFMVVFGPTSGFPLNLLPLDFHSRGFLLTIAFMQEQQPNNLFEKE